MLFIIDLINESTKWPEGLENISDDDWVVLCHRKDQLSSADVSNIIKELFEGKKNVSARAIQTPSTVYAEVTIICMAIDYASSKAGVAAIISSKMSTNPNAYAACTDYHPNIIHAESIQDALDNKIIDDEEPTEEIEPAEIFFEDDLIQLDNEEEALSETKDAEIDENIPADKDIAETQEILDLNSLEEEEEPENNDDDDFDEEIEAPEDAVFNEEPEVVDYLEDTSAIWQTSNILEFITNTIKNKADLRESAKERLMDEVPLSRNFDELNFHISCILPPKQANELYNFIVNEYKKVK